MHHSFRPQAVLNTPLTFTRFLQPLKKALAHTTPLKSKSNHPLEFRFEDEIKVLVYYNLQRFESGNDLLQTLDEDVFARTMVAPPGGIPKSTFFEAIGSRGLKQCQEVFTHLAEQAAALIPQGDPTLGTLVVVDPTLIDCTLDMLCAEYRDNSKKMQAHIGYVPQCSIPRGFLLTDGKADGREYVEELVNPGETGVMDRGFHSHEHFDRWDAHGLKYVCRIKDNTGVYVLHENSVTPGGYILSDEWVVLGSSPENYTTSPVRLIRFKSGSTIYWIATNRFDLTAEQIAEIYLIRWSVEVFFGWWKRFMNVYHLISRQKHGLAVQLLSGLITYLLLAMYCHEQFGETVSIQRVRQLRIAIRNEAIFFIFLPFVVNPLFLYKYATS